MTASCVECDRLWREYEDAVRAHLQIASRFQVAVIEQNTSVLQALEPLHLEALQRRTAARQAFRDHQEASHPEAQSKTQG